MVFAPSVVHFAMKLWFQMLEVLHIVDRYHRRPLEDTAMDHSSRHSLSDIVVVLAEPAAAVTLAVNGSAAVGDHL